MRVQERCRYVPASYVLVAENADLGIEVFADAARNVAMGYSGRRNRADFNYRFNSAERVAANRNAAVNVGDIFQAMWGYDQTNIDYFQVVAVSGQMMQVREISQMREGNGYADQGVCVPAPNNFVGEARRVRIQASGESVFFRFASYANAYRINPVAVVAGVPIYQEANWTAYA
jgi:hypothetical protein